MAMVIEVKKGPTPAAKDAGAARHAKREEAASSRPDRPGGTPSVRYLYDEDGRILAEAIVGTPVSG